MKTNSEKTITTMDKVNVALEGLDYNYTPENGWRQKTASPVFEQETLKTIATKVADYLERQSISAPSQDKIISRMELLQIERLKTYSAECYETIKFNPDAADIIEDICRLFSGDNYRVEYVDVLRQWIFTVKRRMLGLSVKCPIFPIFYGDKGVGKSQFVNALCSPLPRHQYLKLKDGKPVVENDKYADMLRDSLVIHLDEMGGMNKASVEKLKTIIDLDKISNIRIYETTTTTGPVRASMLGCSNTQVKNILCSPMDNRKWCQLDFYNRGNNDEAFCREKISQLLAIDFIKLWKSVNEHGPEPFDDNSIYTRYLKFVDSTVSSETPTIDFIHDVIRTHGGKWLNKYDLFKRYENTVKNPMGKDKFYELIKKMGFIDKKTNKDRGVIVPVDEETEEFYEAVAA